MDYSVVVCALIGEFVLLSTAGGLINCCVITLCADNITYVV